MENKLKVGEKVFFTNEPNTPYDVKAVSERYAVVTRKLHRRHDADLLHFEVKRGAADSFTEAYNDNKDHPVHSLLDFQEMKRAPSDRVFNPYDYRDQEDIDQCIKDLMSEEISLSQRHGTTLEIDWDKTNKINKNLNQ